MTTPAPFSFLPLQQAWRQRDVRAGLLFLAIGLIATVERSLLAQGTASRMGPGYLPLRMGLVLSVLGLAIAWMGALRGRGAAASAGESTGTTAVLGPIAATTLALVVFGLVIEPLGLVPASLLLVVISRLVSLRGHVCEILVLGLVLSAIVVGVFRYGLGLPVGLWPPFLAS